MADGGFHGYLETEPSEKLAAPVASRKPSHLRDVSAPDTEEPEGGVALGTEEESKPFPKSLGMFAKAQIRNLTPDFTQWISHA